MDNALSALLSWQFILFSLAVFAVTWTLRTIIEYYFPKIDGAQLWEKLILPLSPAVFGAVIAYFAKKYAYPDGLATISGRLMFGSVAGMFSGLTYQVIKGMLKDRIQSYINNSVGAVVPPPPPVVPQGVPVVPPQPVPNPPGIMGSNVQQ